MELIDFNPLCDPSFDLLFDLESDLLFKIKWDILKKYTLKIKSIKKQKSIYALHPHKDGSF